MKYKALTVLLLWLAATPLTAAPSPSSLRCTDTLTLAFSPAFTLCLPLSFFRDAIVSNADDILVKPTADGYFFGKIVTASTVGLPAGFDMRAYPRLLFGLTPFGDFGEEVVQRVTAAREAMGNQIGASPLVDANEHRLIYRSASGSRITVIVVKADHPEQLLYLGFESLGAETVDRILQSLR